MPEGKFATAIVVILLIGAPLLGERLSNRHARRGQTGVVEQTRFNSPTDALTCISTTRCTADLDGNGVAGSIEVVPLDGSFYPHNRGLLIVEGNKELLWLPFHHSRDAAPTRIAVIRDSYGTRLVVSDVSSSELSEATFEWNGTQLVKSMSTEAERAALYSVSNLDAYTNPDRFINRRDYVGRDEGLAGNLLSVVKLFFYYMVLLILGAVLLYRKSVRLSAASSPFAKGHP